MKTYPRVSTEDGKCKLKIAKQNNEKHTEKLNKYSDLIQMNESD